MAKKNLKLEKDFVFFLTKNEFFWIQEIRQALNIGKEPPAGQINGSRHAQFASLIKHYKKQGVILCSEVNGNSRQYMSTLFIR